MRNIIRYALDKSPIGYLFLMGFLSSVILNLFYPLFEGLDISAHFLVWLMFVAIFNLVGVRFRPLIYIIPTLCIMLFLVVWIWTSGVGDIQIGDFDSAENVYGNILILMPAVLSVLWAALRCCHGKVPQYVTYIALSLVFTFSLIILTGVGISKGTAIVCNLVCDLLILISIDTIISTVKDRSNRRSAKATLIAYICGWIFGLALSCLVLYCYLHLNSDATNRYENPAYSTWNLWGIMTILLNIAVCLSPLYLHRSLSSR